MKTTSFLVGINCRHSKGCYFEKKSLSLKKNYVRDHFPPNDLLVLNINEQRCLFLMNKNYDNALMLSVQKY